MPKGKFEVGDIVVCDPKWSDEFLELEGLEAGRKYKVISVNTGPEGGQYIGVRKEVDEPVTKYFGEAFFSKVTIN